jgi:hypothetical protein
MRELAVTGCVTSALGGRGESEDRIDPERRGEHDRPEGRNFHA